MHEIQFENVDRTISTILPGLNMQNNTVKHLDCQSAALECTIYWHLYTLYIITPTICDKLRAYAGGKHEYSIVNMNAGHNTEPNTYSKQIE